MDKQTAKQNLLNLIDYCVKHGGIFNDAGSVAAAVQSIEVLYRGEIPVLDKPLNNLQIVEHGNP